MKKQIGVVLLLVFAVVLVFVGCSSPSSAPATKGGMPETMVFSTYDVGSAGYAQSAALANAITTKFGTRIRLMPSGTSVGRAMPLLGGQAKFTFMGDEAYFGSEGTYEFAGYTWGPQDYRVILQHPATVGLFTTKESGIKTVAGIKGKKVAYVIGAPTQYVKMDAFLAFAGLTWSDVTKVEFPSLQDSITGVKEGKADVAMGTTTNSGIYELDASPRGLQWLNFPPEDKEGWAKLQKITSWMFPGQEYRGAGLSKEKPIWAIAYAFPQIVTYATTPADEVYAFVKALDETKDTWQAADPLMPDYLLEKSGKTPAGAAFHDGSIKYLKEKGIWTDADQKWNDQRLARQKTVQTAWKAAIDEANTKKIAEKDFSKFWLDKLAAVK